MPQFRFSTCVCALVVLLLVAATSRAAERATVTSTSTHNSASNGRSNLKSSSGFTFAALSDVPAKRNVKVTDYSIRNGSPSAKSYDPPPEFYRGPGSTGSAASTSTSAASSTVSTTATLNTPYHNHNRDSTAASFVSKPITFPDSNARNKHNGDSSVQLANEFNSWQLLRGSAASGLGAQDRISVKTYSNGDNTHGLTSGYVHGGSGGGGYGFDNRPYGGGVGGGHYLDYPPTTAGHYPGSAHGGGGGGYYGSSADAGLPFDLYGGSSSGGKGHYAGAGGEYSYTYPDIHEPAAHKGHSQELSQKALLAKSFLIPLASAAVLGIAAALVSNPLLLQLGTVSAAPVGAAVVGKRRRRRDLSGTVLEEADRKMRLTLPVASKGDTGSATSADGMAYRAHRQRRLARV